MPILIVTYDLQGPGDYSDFHAMIKLVPWQRVGKSAYVIATESDTTEWFDALSQRMVQNDYLFIGELASTWSGYLPQDVVDWLKKHLGK